MNAADDRFCPPSTGKCFIKDGFNRIGRDNGSRHHLTKNQNFVRSIFFWPSEIRK